MEPFETYEHAGCRVRLFQDDDAESPYSAFEQPSKLLLGSKYEGWGDQFGREWGERMPHPEMNYEDDPPSAVMSRYLTLFGGYVLALPFTITDYGSGGLRARITEPNDEPASGYVVMTAEDRDKIGVPVGEEEKAARADFEIFADWLEGYVVGYVVTAPDGSEDSCWGFYGRDDSYVREEANDAAEWLNHERLVNQEPTDVAEVLAGHTA